MQCAVDVREQVVRLGDELEAFFEEALLDFRLTVGEKVVRVRRLARHVLHHRIHAQDVVLAKRLLVFALEVELTQQQLNSVLGAERVQQSELARLDLAK